MVLDLFHQYSTAEPMSAGLKPSWVGGLDQMRLASYNLYEQIYWNVPEAFKLIHRGSDSQPIYLPAAKKIVETLHRYLAKGLEITPDPRLEQNTTTSDAMNTLINFLRRERFYSKFTAAKRYGIIRGDWLLHMYADPERAEGSRISVEFIDPASYFPIYNEDNIDEVIGAHLVDTVEMDDGTFIRRLTYRKATETGGPSPILRTDELYEVDKWGGPGVDEGSPIRTLQPPVTLPSPIDSLPVYHITNFEEPGTIWGSSELRGFERLISALNQGISDEELTLALEGLGVYATTAGRPMNEETNELEEWNLGPARVVEHPEGTDFRRVTGVGSVSPYQDHLEFIEKWMDQGSGTPDIAAGRVDVQVAESGVALALSMSPLLERAGEREEVVTDRLNNWLYDLRSWYAAYEPGLSGPLAETLFIPSYGPKLPVNRKQQFEELMSLLQHDPPVVSRQWVRTQLTELGYEFPDHTTMMDEMLFERTAFAQIDADVTGARMDSEITEEDAGPEVTPPGQTDNGQLAEDTTGV